MHSKRSLVGLGATLIFAMTGTVSPDRTAAVGLQLAAGRPNVLFIMSDDLNDDMGAFGHPIVQTPNIDRLAAQGVRFDRAFTQYALCNPSRASLMTGLRPDTTKVYDLTTHFRAAVPDVVTMPQMFQQAGYFAARVGKIYHYGNPGDIGTSGLDDPPSWNKFVNPKGIDINEQPKLSFAGPARGLGSSLSYYASPAQDEEHTDGMVATETIKLIEQNRTRPFFIAAGFYRPHCPYIAPKKYFDLYSLDRIPVSEYSELLLSQSPTAARGISWNVPEQEQREAVRAYYASISFMDAQLGRILDALDRLNLRQNTIIVFMSDHGYHLGDHGGLWMKQTVFERATRTPMMMAGPGVTAKGQVSHRIVELLDIYPTLAALARVAAPAGLPGRSFQPLLVNPKVEWDHAALSQVRRPISIGAVEPGRAAAGDPASNRAPAGQSVGRGATASSLTGPDADGAAVYQTAAPGPDTGYTIRTELYRYISWNDGKAGEELFDELNDSGETRNLVKQPFYANVLADMRQRLARMKNAAVR
jgi:iduronate 2-sulfatase